MLPGCGGLTGEKARLPGAVAPAATVETAGTDGLFEKRAVAVVPEETARPPLREFASVAELRAWCERNLAVILTVGQDGTVDLLEPTPNSGSDCDDYAERLQRLAISDGYLMSVQLVQGGCLFGVEVTPEKGCHMGNLAIAGNGVYFIEPQPGMFRIVKVCDRD